MKRNNMLLMLAIVSILVCSLSLTAVADCCQSGDTTILRASACPYCGNTMSISDTVYGPWIRTNLYNCPEFPDCIVSEYTRSVDRYYECAYCGYYFIKSLPQIKTVHSILH